MYANPTHTRSERDAYWLELDAKFGHAVGWAGIEDSRASMWQKQGHLFSHALYYIEYGIAQLGALQLWANYRTDPEGAIRSYKAGLRLGGSKPLPELFKAAGLDYDFPPPRVQKTWKQVEQVLESLPA
jgi:oligoendopeptidase F